MKSCRFCGRDGMHEILDLHHQPPSDSFLTKEQLREPEVYYLLKVYVCDACWLVQVPESKKATEIFNETYPYYSSQSPTNVSHAKGYVEMMCKRFGYTKGSVVWETGSNDGYLLQHFNERGICCHGIEPSEGPTKVAMSKGISTIKKFFNAQLASDMADGMGQADLICSINTLAHQPDLNDFVKAIKIGLKPEGITTHEFPHLMNLIDQCQFDTIYHEHYDYFSFITVCEIFRRHGLEIFDVDEIPEHGGSLRIYAQHQGMKQPVFANVISLLDKEIEIGMNSINYYLGFQARVDQIKRDLVRFLIEARYDDKMVVGYGAPAKGNTLLNYCGIRQDLVEFTVDRSPHKQGLYLPGSHIRVTDEEELRRVQPDYVLILPWNLKTEIMNQLSYIKSWGGKFIIPLPTLEVI